jgi:CRISPR/Cas system-associated exonuclease Cas4 (RecB family)
LEEARTTALEKLREGFRQSRDGVYRSEPKEAVGLFEHEYAEDIGDKEWQRIRDRVYRCLDHFYASDIRETILETRIENWQIDGVTVYVAPDFALRNPQGNALVIDWKTGWQAVQDRTQIVCYGLFAKEKWGVDAKRAIGELHYLLSGTVDIVTLDDTTLEEGTQHIRSSISAMKERLSDPEANRAEMERFEQTENRDLCARCNYRRVCWPEWPET